jgi:enterochelin esterase family protein
LKQNSGDGEHCYVTFFWRGDSAASRVSLLGGFPSGSFFTPLRRLPGSEVWYLTQIHPTDARFGYLFQVNGPETLPWTSQALSEAMGKSPPKKDPLNPKEYAGWSYAELPAAPSQPWIVEQPETRKGRVMKTTLKSHKLNAEYPIKVYIPPEYDEKGDSSWLLLAFDGGFPSMETSVANLFAAQKIPSLVVVGVGNISGDSRERDLSGSSEFAGFLAGEVVPWARTNYHVYGDASHTIVGGTSLGGFMAIYCGLNHSDVFGKVLALSPTLLLAPGQADPNPVWIKEEKGLLARQFVSQSRLPLKLYISVGRYESFIPFSMVYEARRLRDVLEAKGYRVGYSEFDGGHMEVCWRGVFAEGLMSLTGP